MKIALVASRFNSVIVERLVEGAKQVIEPHGSYELFWVPGALEIPVVAQKLSRTNRYQALVCLGAVIKGASDHYEHVSREVHNGVTRVSLDAGIPVAMGVLTVESMAQAFERAGGTHGNVGANAASAAVDVLKLFERVRELT